MRPPRVRPSARLPRTLALSPVGSNPAPPTADGPACGSGSGGGAASAVGLPRPRPTGPRASVASSDPAALATCVAPQCASRASRVEERDGWTGFPGA